MDWSDSFPSSTFSETKSLLLFVVEGGHLTDKGFTFEMGLELRRYVLSLVIEVYQ